MIDAPRAGVRGAFAHTHFITKGNDMIDLDTIYADERAISLVKQLFELLKPAVEQAAGADADGGTIATGLISCAAQALALVAYTSELYDCAQFGPGPSLEGLAQALGEVTANFAPSMRNVERDALPLLIESITLAAATHFNNDGMPKPGSSLN